MSTTGPSNPTAPKESKSAQKKKAKAEALAKAQAPPADSAVPAESTRADSPTNGTETSSESPYVKELYKYKPSQYCCIDIMFRDLLMSVLLQEHP